MAMQSYIVRQSDLTKLRKYNRSTVCEKCAKDIKIGDLIRRAKNHTYHTECLMRCYH